MEPAFWSLRNKMEDIERALARDEFAAARMNAYELGIRLSHATHECLRAKEDNTDAHQAAGSAPFREELLIAFEKDLERLSQSLRERDSSSARQSLEALFAHLG